MQKTTAQQETKPFFPARDPSFISSEYGWRSHPDGSGQKFHAGMDIGGGGTTHPIYATQSGTVIYNAWTDWGGWGIRIDHSHDVYYSMYIHLNSRSPIPIGTVVAKGQEIGTMGNTGDSFGIHLHFEIATSPNGFSTEAGTINPRIYLDMDFDPNNPVDPTDPTDPTDPGNMPYFLTNRHNTNMRRRSR